MPIQERSRERNARRAAARQDLVLKRNPTRDERATGHGMYCLVHADTGQPVHPVPSRLFCLTLLQVERILDQGHKAPPPPLPPRPPLPKPSQPSKSEELEALAARLGYRFTPSVTRSSK